MSYKHEITETFRLILEQKWDDQEIWEQIRDKQLTAAPALVGNLYEEAATKVMFVGRCLNGWEVDFSDCSTLEKTLESILEQKSSFDTFVYPGGFKYEKDGKQCKYNHENSNFFRLIKHILEEVGESDVPLHNTWVKGTDSKNWHQRFVWAFLYCVAPRYGGNMDWKMVKPNMAAYIRLMELQIKEYKPDVVVFITDEGWFIPWKKQPSFDEMLDTYNPCNIDNVIVGKGEIANSKVIICKRPDARGKTYEDVQNMAKTIANIIKNWNC